MCVWLFCSYTCLRMCHRISVSVFFYFVGLFANSLYSFTLQHIDYIDRETLNRVLLPKREEKRMLACAFNKTQQLKHKSDKVKQQSLNIVIIKRKELCVRCSPKCEQASFFFESLILPITLHRGFRSISTFISQTPLLIALFERGDHERIVEIQLKKTHRVFDFFSIVKHLIYS